MKRIMFAAVVVIVSACGEGVSPIAPARSAPAQAVETVEPGAQVWTCSTICGLSVRAPMPVDCSNIDIDFHVAAGIIVNTNAIASGAELCAALRRTTISITTFDGGVGGEYFPGNILPDGGIIGPQLLLDETLGGVAHEMLHALDAERGTLDFSDPHADWGVAGTPKGGYLNTIHEYYGWHCSATGTGAQGFPCDRDGGV